MYFNEAIHGVAAVGLVLPRQLLVLRRGPTVAVTAVVLPVGNPVDQHLSYLNVCYRHFLHSVHLERWRMQHLLNRSRSRLEDPQRDHLVETELQVLGLDHYVGVHHIVFVARVINFRHVLLLLVGSTRLPTHILHMIAIIV